MSLNAHSRVLRCLQSQLPEGAREVSGWWWRKMHERCSPLQVTSLLLLYNQQSS